MQVIERYGAKLTADFAENKKILEQVAIIRSKGLKNEIAGYITKYIKREKSSKELASEDEVEIESDETVDKTTDNSAIVEEMAEIPEEIEIVEETIKESS
jgi:small subunit ribosomal protein S17e